MVSFFRAHIADHHSQSHICHDAAAMAAVPPSSYPQPPSDLDLDPQIVEITARNEMLGLGTLQGQIIEDTQRWSLD